MRLGLIDVGTNSIRLDVYQLYPNGQQERLERRKVMVRLGQEVFLSGELHPDGMRRTLKAMEEFKAICDDLCVDSIRAIATSALRSARNQSKFLKEVRSATGIELEVIAGQQEAELILAGIRQDWRSSGGNFGFVDIGGGSTEIGIVSNDKVVFLESLELGAARLKQLCFDDTEAGVRECRKTVLAELGRAFKGKRIPEIPLLLGSSGTVNALQKIFRTAGKGAAIRTQPLTSLITELAALSLKERKKYPGLSTKRADIIVPGAIILQEVMLQLRVATVHFTKYALRDGLLVSALEHSASVQRSKKLKRLK